MEGINSFDKGLHQSNSPLTQPEGSYFDALNWVRNDEGRLVSEKQEKNIWGLNDDLKGFVNLDNQVILLFKESISVWEKDASGNQTNTNIFDTLSRSFKLNIQDGVEVRARKAFNNDRIIYFVDSVNVPRYFNLDLYLRAPTTNYNDLKDFNLFLEYKLPEVSNVQITTGGNLLSGVYSIVLRYRSSVDNKTFFGIPSKFYSITDDATIDDNYDGCPPGTATNKLITFQTTHIDDNYPYIEPVIITYEGNTLVAYSLGILANFNNNTINFSGPTQYVERVDIREISSNPLFYNTAQCIEAKDNILTLSNLTSKKYDITFQTVANNIIIRKTEKYLQETKNRDINFSSNSFQAVNQGLSEFPLAGGSFQGIIRDIENNVGNTLDPRLQNTNKGFQPYEVYSFSFTPIYTDGSIGFAYHIPCNNINNDPNYTKIYSSIIPYPFYLGPALTGGIRHHEIPSEPTDRYIELTAENIILTQSQKDAIQGYIIGYEKRDSDLKKRIIDEGVIRPYLSKPIGGPNAGRPIERHKLQPFLTGSCALVPDNLGFWFGTSGIACQYRSPATERGLKINPGYELFINRYAISGVTNRGVNESGIGIIRVRDIDRGAAMFFEEASSTTSFNTNAVINRVIEVDTVNAETMVDSEYRIYKSTKFIHLSLSKGVIDLNYYKTGGGNNADAYTHYHDGNNSEDIHYINTAVRSPVMVCATIYNNNKGLYGNLENAEYIPSVVVYNTNTTFVTLDGDTYKTKYWFEFKDILSKKSALNESIANDNYNFYLLAGIYITSQNNWALRHSDVGEVPYYPKYKKLVDISNTVPLALESIDINKGLSTGYNKLYSAISDTKVSFHRPLIFEEVNQYPNRTIYSNKAFEGELVDQWRLFPANYFHDIPKNKGQITDTFIWNNDFYHHTERSIFKSFFNASVTQQNSQGQTILGNSGVFQLPSVELIAIDGGYMGTTTKAGLNTPFGRIFLDNNQGKVFLFAGESPIEISDLGLFFFFRDFINPNDKYTLGYDYENKRVLLSNNVNTISFYPKTQTWTSFHDFTPKFYIPYDKELLAFKGVVLYNINDPDPIKARKFPSISFIINNNPNEYKRFDRMDFNTFVYPSLSNNIAIDSKTSESTLTFTDIQCWNYNQNSGNLPLKLVTNFIDAYDYDDTQIYVRRFKGDYKIELPLDAVKDHSKDIFDPTNLDVNKSFKEPLTSKFLYVKLSYNLASPLVLSYVKTFSKPTVG